LLLPLLAVVVWGVAFGHEGQRVVGQQDGEDVAAAAVGVRLNEPAAPAVGKSQLAGLGASFHAQVGGMGTGSGQGMSRVAPGPEQSSGAVASAQAAITPIPTHPAGVPHEPGLLDGPMLGWLGAYVLWAVVVLAIVVSAVRGWRTIKR
jgi:hypothetical protein